jgi:hypothetical protein
MLLLLRHFSFSCNKRRPWFPTEIWAVLESRFQLPQFLYSFLWSRMSSSSLAIASMNLCRAPAGLRVEAVPWQIICDVSSQIRCMRSLSYDIHSQLFYWFEFRHFLVNRVRVAGVLSCCPCRSQRIGPLIEAELGNIIGHVKCVVEQKHGVAWSHRFSLAAFKIYVYCAIAPKPSLSTLHLRPKKSALPIWTPSLRSNA